MIVDQVLGFHQVEWLPLISGAVLVLDPAAGTGVLRAIMSGMMAGHAAARSRELPYADARYAAWLGDLTASLLTRFSTLFPAFVRPDPMR